MRDNQKRGALKQHDLLSLADVGKVLQMLLEQTHVGDERANNAGPRLEQTLVPDRRRKPCELVPVGLGEPAQVVHHLAKHVFTLRLLHEVHLVHQYKHLGVGRELAQMAQALGESGNVLLDFFAFNVKHMDKHLHHAEQVVALRGEVVFNKYVLATAVPQVESHVAKKAEVRMLNVNGGAESPRVEGRVVAKDDAPHGALAGAAAALGSVSRTKDHQQKRKRGLIAYHEKKFFP